MAACPLCESRKGKRACPALTRTICPVCCGEKRIVEIACTPGCAYLAQGAENDMRREVENYMQHQDPKKVMRWVRVIESFGFLLEAIERTAAASAGRTTDDTELLPALRSTARTFDSEAKGILYEDVPTSLTAQVLARDLAAGIRALAKAMDEARAAEPSSAGALPTWGPAEAAESLEVLADRCEYHLSRKPQAGSFLAHLKRVHLGASGPEGSKEEGPRIVLG